MRFEFATAGRVIFGSGTAGEAAQHARALGSRALVVTGRSPQRADWLAEALRAEGMSVLVCAAAGEPTTEDVNAVVARARAAGCDVVIGCGGGSALDLGKAAAALLANGGEPLDYLEVVGRGKPLAQPSLPFIAIPTTAGTGAEATRNAVLASPAHRVKASLRSPFMLPRLALVDPLLTHSLPPDATARAGMDALSQLIEPYVCNSPNPLIDLLCRDGIPRAARALPRACADGADAAARADMALAGLYSGMALANARLGAVHGLAGPLGGMFPAPHSAVCAALLPHVMEANVRALRTRAPESPALVRYAEIAQWLTGDAAARAEAGVEWVKALCEELPLQPLSAYGVSEAALPAIAAQAQQASSMKGNPVRLEEAELVEVLRRAV